MPRYRIRLNDPRSEEFLVVVTHADSEEEALRVAQRNADKMVAYRSQPAVLADDLEQFLDEHEYDDLKGRGEMEPEPREEVVAPFDDLVAKALEDMPRSAKRGRLHMHQLTEAYQVVSVNGQEV